MSDDVTSWSQIKWSHDTQHTQHNDIQHTDIQHNDIQHNDTQHNGLVCETQQKWPSITVNRYNNALHHAYCCYAESRVLFIVLVDSLLTQPTCLVLSMCLLQSTKTRQEGWVDGPHLSDNIFAAGTSKPNMYVNIYSCQ